MMVSFIRRCYETETRSITLEEVFDAIRSGEHGLKEKITQIRNNYEFEFDTSGGDLDKAKKSIAEFKAELPGFLPSGTFSKRDNASLVEYSSKLMADLDDIGEAGQRLKDFFKESPYVHACAFSPSGHGLKILFNVVDDPSRHLDSFRAIKQFVLDATGFDVDEACKDPARICFFTYDPDIWVRVDGNEPIKPADPLPRVKSLPNLTTGLPNLTTREQIAFNLLGPLNHDSGKGGYFCRCPGETLHTAKTAGKHTILYLDTVPTLSCQHESCSATVEAFNKVLRSEIGKAEWTKPEPHLSTSSSPNGAEDAKEDWPAKIQSSLVIANKADLGSLVLKPRVPLLGDWLCEGDYGIIFGPRGVAKTWYGLMIAHAIATGETLGEWEATKSKVLFIDGEMPADMIRDRILGFGGSENMTLLNHEILFDRTQGIINVTNKHQQDAILDLCIQQHIKVLIIDNLSVCAIGIKENDSFEWEQLHHWLLRFRRHGIAVVLLHHAGKTGLIRGTTKREDAAAWVISLTDAKERAEDKRGSRFISMFAKPSRNCMNAMAHEWHVVLEDGRAEVNWKLAQGADVMLKIIKDGVQECGMIATEMGVSAATVCRLAKKLEKSGKIEIRARKYVLTLAEECEDVT